MSRQPIFSPQIIIDRASPVPLYHQIAQPLRKLIEDGTVAPGTRLEDEISLAKRLGVSRPTARRALQSLVDSGLVIRRRAVGTLVSPKAIHRTVELTSLYDDLAKDGQEPTTKVLRYEIQEPTEVVRGHLELPIRDEDGHPTMVANIHRLRYANGKPLALLTNYLPLSVAPSPEELEHTGLYQLMRQHGYVITTARQTISARKATLPEAEALDEPRNAAMLAMERIGFTAEGRAIEYGTHVYRASLYKFTLTLSE